MKLKSKNISLLLLAIMLLNSLTVLAGGENHKEELHFKLVFDIFADQGSINNGEEVTEMVISGEDASVGGVLQGDQVVATIKNQSQIFIMEAGYNLEEREVIKKSNCQKPYFIDMEKVKEVYKEGLVKYIGHRGYNISFIINGKLLSEEYNKGNYNIRENIYFTLANQIVVKNDAKCKEADSYEDLPENVRDRRESYYFSRNENLNAHVLYIRDSEDQSLRNIYTNNLMGSRIPSYSFNASDLGKYLDLKDNPLFRESIKTYFEDGERREVEHFFNLIGYEIRQGLGEDFNIDYISEKEYSLIELIGIDKFVYLKSKATSLLMDYPENKDYKFDYEHKVDEDLLELTYGGEMEELSPASSELEVHIKSFLATIGDHLVVKDKQGNPISDPGNIKKILSSILNNGVGSNIIGEIIRGEASFARDKENNDLNKLDLNNKYEAIRAKLNIEKKQTNEYLETIKDLSYTDPNLSSPGIRGVRALAGGPIESGPGQDLLDRNRLNQMNYRYKKIIDYYNEEMLTDLMLDREEQRQEDKPTDYRQVKSILEDLRENEKASLKIEEEIKSSHEKLDLKLGEIKDKEFEKGKYELLEKLGGKLEGLTLDTEEARPGLEIASTGGLVKEFVYIDQIEELEAELDEADQKLKDEISKIEEARPIVNKLKFISDADLGDLLADPEEEEITSVEDLETIIAEPINNDIAYIKAAYEDLGAMDQSLGEMLENKDEKESKQGELNTELDGKNSGENEKTKNKIKSLIAEKQAVIKEINDLTRELSKKEKDLANKKAELVGLNYQAKTSQAELDRIQAILDNLVSEDEREFYERELAYKTLIRNDDQARAEDKQTQVDSLDSELSDAIGELESKKEAKDGKIQDIDNKILAEEGKLGDQKDIILLDINGVAQVEGLPGGNQAIEMGISSDYNEIISLQSQLKKINRQVEVLNSEIGNLELDKGDLDSQIKKEEDFIKNSLKKKQALDSLQRSIEEKEADLDAKESSIHPLGEEIQALEDAILDLETTLDGLKTSEGLNPSEENKLEITRLEGEINGKKEELAVKTTTLRETQARILALEEEIPKSKQEKEKLIRTVYRLMDYAEPELSLEAKEQELEGKYGEKTQKEVELEDLKKDLESANPEDKPGIAGEISSLEYEIPALESGIQELESEILQAKKDLYIEVDLILEKEEEIKDLKGQVEETDEKIKSKEEEVLGKEDEASGKRLAISNKYSQILSKEEKNQSIKNENQGVINRQKKLIEREMELTEYLKETIRATSERKEIEIDKLKSFAQNLGKLDFYMDKLEKPNFSLKESGEKMELLLGELEYLSDYIKTYKFQKDRYDYQYIHERLESEKSLLKGNIGTRKDEFTDQKEKIVQSRGAAYNKSNEIIEDLRIEDLAASKLDDNMMDLAIATFSEKLSGYESAPAEEKIPQDLVDGLKALKDRQTVINDKTSGLKKYNSMGPATNQYQHKELVLEEISTIEALMKETVIDTEGIGAHLNAIAGSYSSYKGFVDAEQVKLETIKSSINSYQVKKNDQPIDYDGALDEIAAIENELNNRAAAVDQIDKLYQTSPLTSGTVEKGRSFRFLYKLSENNKDSKEVDLQEYTVNIPWLKARDLASLEGIGESLEKSYIDFDIEHLSGLYNIGRTTLTQGQKDANYFMFNPTVGSDSSIALANQDGNKPMKVKLAKDKKLVLSDEILNKYLEDKRANGDLGKFGLKLAYIKIDQDIVWRDQLRDLDLTLDGKTYSLKDGQLSIYFNELQKKHEGLIQAYKAEEIPSEKAKILGEIEENMASLKATSLAPRVQLVFEDNLNVLYYLKYVDQAGENILDPVRIKSLAGLDYKLPGPEYIVDRDGNKYELISPSSQTINTKLNPFEAYEPKVYEFKYRKIGSANIGEVTRIPGYSTKEVKMPGNKLKYEIDKVQENTSREKPDKNNQANYNLDQDQKELNIRFINVNICSVNNCQVHTGEQRGTQLASEVMGWMHSKTYVPKAEAISLDLSAYLDKYASGIWSYGLEETERGVKYPINLPQDKTISIEPDFAKETGSIYLNLYRVNYLPHYPSWEGGGSGEKKFFEYTIDHKYYNREAQTSGQLGEDGLSLSHDYSPYEDVKGDYSIHLKYDLGMINSVMDTSFTNFIYKYWDQYRQMVLRQDPQGKTFDKLIIKELNYKEVSQGDSIELVDNIVSQLELIHNPNLDKGIYKYSKIELVEESGKNQINHRYEINFRLTTSRDLLESDWYSYLGFDQAESTRKNIDLFKKLEANKEPNRKTVFEYYFTGAPIWTPEVSKTQVIEEHINISTGEVFASHEMEVYVGDLINISKPEEEAWPENYRYIYTRPEAKSFKAEPGGNRISHYYLHEDYLLVNYHSNGGRFGLGTDQELTSSDRNLRMVVAEKDQKLAAYHPKDITRGGYQFVAWGQKEVVEGENVLVEVPEDKLVEEGLNLYAIWEETKETPKPLDPKDPGGGGGGGDRDPKPEEPKQPVEVIDYDRKGRPIGQVLEPMVEYQLNKMDHFAYIKGYPDLNVRPNGDITREEVAMVFYRLMEPEYRDEIETLDHSYSDLREDAWSRKAIASLSQGGLLLGYGDGTFKPQAKMTRAEISKVVARFTDTIVLETEMTDIIDHWAEDYINTVQNKGWIKGYQDGSFKPNQLLTRAEFVTMINSLLERKVRKENILPGIKNFKDLEEKWYYEAMVEAINGHDYEDERLEDGSEKWTGLVDTEFPD